MVFLHHELKPEAGRVAPPPRRTVIVTALWTLAGPKIHAGGPSPVCCCAMAGSVCGLGAEHDGVAERVEAADQALGGAMLVDAVEVVGAEVGKGDGALQHVEGGNQYLVRDSHGRLLCAHACPQPVELVAQVAALGSRAADRGGDQGGLEVWIALAGAATLLLAGAFVVGRAQTGPGGKALSGAEDGHVHPDLGDNGRRCQRVHAGDSHQQGLLGGKGAHGGSDSRVYLGEVAPDLFQAPDMHPEQQALVLGERPVEGEGEPVDLALVHGSVKNLGQPACPWRADRPG